MKAAIPHNEAERLATLARYAILDSGAEQIYDDITRLAAQICEAPTALITLIDADRQWFKSNLGLPGTETSREQAFCAHTILQPHNVLVVEDATQDIRFADNVAVIDDPSIRFYAGSPLTTADGYALGTLCVVDYQPRSLGIAQVRALQALSRQVMSLLELRRVNRDLQATNSALHREITERIRVQGELEETIVSLEQANRHIANLEGLIPICSGCRHIRTGENDWEPLEKYLAEHANVIFSHGLCDNCLVELYPEYYAKT